MDNTLKLILLHHREGAKFEDTKQALLDLFGVSQQRELLYFFAKRWNENQTTAETTINSDDIKNCIEKYNCA